MGLHDKFDVNMALGTERLRDGTLLVAGEDWKLSPINLYDRRTLIDPKSDKVAPALSKLRIAAAQIAKNPNYKYESSNFDAELKLMLDKENFFLAVPEAEGIIDSVTAPVVEFNGVVIPEGSVKHELLVTGLGKTGLLEPGRGRQLYVALLYEEERPPYSTYVPHIN